MGKLVLLALGAALLIILAQQFADLRHKARVRQAIEERHYLALVGIFAMSTVMFAVPIFLILLVLRLFLRALIF